MNELITLVFLSGVGLAMFLLRIAKMRKVNTASILAVFFYLTIFVFIGLEALCLYESISFMKFKAYAYPIFTMLFATLVCVFSLLAIRDLTSKKVKTLWRLPIIGLLLGLFSDQFQFVIHLFFYLILVFVFYKNDLKIHFAKIAALSLWVAAIYFIENSPLWYLNLMIIYLLWVSYDWWDMLSIKFILWEKNE